MVQLQTFTTSDYLKKNALKLVTEPKEKMRKNYFIILK